MFLWLLISGNPTHVLIFSEICSYSVTKYWSVGNSRGTNSIFARDYLFIFQVNFLSVCRICSRRATFGVGISECGRGCGSNYAGNGIFDAVVSFVTLHGSLVIGLLRICFSSSSRTIDRQLSMNSGTESHRSSSPQQVRWFSFFGEYLPAQENFWSQHSYQWKLSVDSNVIIDWPTEVYPPRHSGSFTTFSRYFTYN